MKIHPVFNVNLLSFAEPDPIPGHMPEPPPPVVTDKGEEEWEVETILDWRWKNKTRKTNLQYKVHWKGYPTGEDSWEPAENLQNAPDLVQDFHRRFPNAPRPPSRPSASSRPRRRT